MNLRLTLAVCTLVTLAAADSSTAQAPGVATDITTILWNTGVDSARRPLPGAQVDPNWRVNGGPAYVIGDPGSIGWIGNTSSSAWISASLGTYAGGGPFTFHMTFDLSGLNPATALLWGSLAADDEAEIYLNGALVFKGSANNTNPWDSWDDFLISSDFISGINALDVVVRNDIETADDGPSGLQIRIHGTAQAGKIDLNGSLR